MNLYGYLKEWRKNPKWSLSCCLACILPLVKIPGEIGNLVETKDINKHLPPEDIEMPTISAAVQDNGAVDVILDVGGKEDSNLDQDDICSDTRPQSAEEVVHTNVTAVQGSVAAKVTDEEVQQGNGNQVKVTDDNGEESSAMHGEGDISFKRDTVQNNGEVGVTSDDGILGDRRYTNTMPRKMKRKRHPKTVQDSDSPHNPSEGEKGDGSSGVVLQDSCTETGEEKNDVRTNAASVPDIGQHDAMVEERDQGGGETRMVQHDPHQTDKKCHQGTQTELTTTMTLSGVKDTQV